MPLSRERVLAAAVEIADAEGIDALTMRALAERLGVEAMSLYYHVANKAALLDGVADAVVGEILAAVTPTSAKDGADGEESGDPAPGLTASGAPSSDPSFDWRATLRTRVLAARAVLLRHPWAPPLLTRPGAFGPAAVFYFEGVLAILVRGGFSYDLAHHAIHALGSRAIGFSQELFTPGDATPDESDEVLEELAAQLPHLMGMLSEISHDDPASNLGWCDDQAEFEFGIDALLDGLEAARRRTSV
ncbi:MAG: TetR family transcriptional regulator [Actinomycetales bacterium]|nr:TetR family transcriptional regulator [Actinomycetales bacterium]